MTIRSWLLSLVAVLTCWFGLQLAIMRWTDAAPGAVVLFPPTDFISRLPKDIAFVNAGDNWIAVKSDVANLGRSLNAAGAWIVLPAGLPGCLPLSQPLRD